MITKRTLPFVIIIVVLAVAVVIGTRFSPKRQEQLNDELYNAVSGVLGATESVQPIEDALQKGADPNTIFNLDGFMHRTALEMAASNGSPNAVALLLKHHANPNTNCSRGTALHAAVEASNPVVIDLLAQHGANVNAVSAEGRTPLIVAVEMGRITTVKHLLSLKADPSVKGNGGMTALGVAKHQGRKEIADALRQAGAKE